jgi:hypothetical protein
VPSTTMTSSPLRRLQELAAGSASNARRVGTRATKEANLAGWLSEWNYSAPQRGGDNVVDGGVAEDKTTVGKPLGDRVHVPD